MSKPGDKAWAPAFVPAGKVPTEEIPERVLHLLQYCAWISGFRVTGIRVRLQLIRDDQVGEMDVKMKRTLKHALRQCGLRCISFGLPGESKGG